MFRFILDNTKASSLANRFRRKRFQIFLRYLNSLEKPVHIFDIGGTQNYWYQMGLAEDMNYHITLLNKHHESVKYRNMDFIHADACDLGKLDLSDYDIIHSNSLIEHLDSFERQKYLADAVISSGKPYFIQTPNYWFPFEPHFLFPCFQFLPFAIRKFLVMNFNLGWYKKCKDEEEADRLINSVRLLKLSELKTLFPQGFVITERFLLLPKSFIVTHSKFSSGI